MAREGPGAFRMPVTHHIAVQLLQLGSAGGRPRLPCVDARPPLPFLNHLVPFCSRLALLSGCGQAGRVGCVVHRHPPAPFVTTDFRCSMELPTALARLAAEYRARAEQAQMMAADALDLDYPRSITALAFSCEAGAENAEVGTTASSACIAPTERVGVTSAPFPARQSGQDVTRL
jgi:hypothetical protein